MKRQRRLTNEEAADILWTAANVNLSVRHISLFDSELPGDVTTYSCTAVLNCCHTDRAYTDMQRFLKKLGCPTSSPECFLEFERTFARQGVRYMWLLLAMHYAQDHGIY